MDNNSVSEENVQMILSMGFPSESEVRRALRLAKNDLFDAVAILTNELPSTSYDAVEDMDIDLREKSLVTFGPQLPPSYDEVYDNGQVKVMNEKKNNAENNQSAM